ncbi:MAG: ATP-dependent DNA helicase RecG [Proteobacteria bacterium]|nr:ATP-dependent DNA helicase RecG [Pseudomonadota bacterium]
MTVGAQTSLFERSAQAVRGPLEFVLLHPDSRERVRDLAGTLGGALQRAAELRIPPEAKRRFAAAAERLGGAEPDAFEIRKLGRGLEPLLHPDYASRALGQPTERIPGIGPKTARSLARKHIHSVEDLLFFLPRVYEDRRNLRPIQELEVGRAACFTGSVVRTHVAQLRNGRRVLEVVLGDGSSAVSLKWFRGIEHFRDRIRPGQRLLVAGDVRRYRYSKELHHPDIELLGEQAPPESLERIVPVYPSVEGVPPRTLRRLVQASVEYASDLVAQWLPQAHARRADLPEVGQALAQVHEPGAHLEPGELEERNSAYHRRLAAEELFLLQVGLELRRKARGARVAKSFDSTGSALRQAIGSLPFELTGDQSTAWGEIASDLARAHPMNRMLIGDVGTGKTVLAVLAGVAAHHSGALSAVLAPTEILAEQHFATFRQLAEPLGLRVALLTGSTPAAERRSLTRLLTLGEIAIVIGTHALLAGSVRLPRLGLVVIDEQQRFGVEQRQTLASKGEQPHVLSMSATPIPRTLALTLFGDLDHSLIRQRPPGRAPVTTRVVGPGEGRQVFDAVKATLARGEQVYVVHPLIEESETQDLKDATRGYQRLRRALPEARIALLHGRMPAEDRVEIMRRFASGDLSVLVSTTVIEVGVDVPRATLLVVQHAERFGLAQLHQLRGRVGRGQRPGTALLIGDPKGEGAFRRLAVLESSDSGFDIAEEDLRIRGPGHWLGTRQAGRLPDLRLADLVRHSELIELARAAARESLERDPQLDLSPRLRDAVERRWGRRLDFSGVL